MKINCKRDRLIGILLAAMLLLGADAYAQRMRVQGHVTNQQGKSIPNVNIIDPVTNERIESPMRTDATVCWRNGTDR